MPIPAGSLGGPAAAPAHQHSSSSEDSRTEDLLQALNGKSKALRKQEQNRQAQQRHRAKAKVCAPACQSLTSGSSHSCTVRASCLYILSRCVIPRARARHMPVTRWQAYGPVAWPCNLRVCVNLLHSCLHNRKCPEYVAGPWVQQQDRAAVAGYLCLLQLDRESSQASICA